MPGSSSRQRKCSPRFDQDPARSRSGIEEGLLSFLSGRDKDHLSKPSWILTFSIHKSQRTPINTPNPHRYPRVQRMTKSRKTTHLTPAPFDLPSACKPALLGHDKPYRYWLELRIFDLSPLLFTKLPIVDF